MSRIALIGENSVEYVDKLIEIWNSNSCAVLIDWKIPIATSLQMMEESNVTKCFIEQKIFDRINKLTNTNIAFYPYTVSSFLPRILPDNIRIKFKINYSYDEAVVIYSSGTTGKAKGIILSHFAITKNADAILRYMNLTENDCIYTIRPFSHSSTLTGELLVTLLSGCKLLLSPTIVPPRYILGNIHKYQATIICVNPTILNMLCDEMNNKNNVVTSLRTIYSSGSLLHEDILHKAKKCFINVDIYNVYGLTEAGPRVSAQRLDCCKSNSVGKPIYDVEVIIVDDNGNILPAGVRGLLHVNSSSRCSGYISGKSKFNSLYKNWLNTGDIGYFDKNGELYIVGRKDDMIILGAHKIYPNDVAAQIMKYANIDECFITSVRICSNDILCCLYKSSSDIGDGIKTKLCSVLMKHEIPRVYIRTEAIPKTRNGKVSVETIKEIINIIVRSEEIHKYDSC